jgi:Domain of unknown function (DUF4423)
MSELGHFELAASQILRALRGPRSQVAWARRLGYRGNPITDWEHGRRFPSAPEALRVASRANVDLPRAFATFSPMVPAPSGRSRWIVAAWLDALRGSTSIMELARVAGVSRFSVARWLAGTSTPRLPDFLRLLDAITGRAAEWVALLVPIESVPGLEPIYRRMSAAQRISLELPWSDAVLRVLETTAYAALGAHSDAFIAGTLGISEREVSEILATLCDADIVERLAGAYRVKGTLVVDTKGDPEAAQRVRRHWASAALARQGHANTWFAYNVISVSEQDCDRIERRLRAAFREIRNIVKESQPAERAALLTIQLARW